MSKSKSSQDGVAIDVQEISVSYGGIKAVDEVSFAVSPGSIIGLIGPNGAGKTTVFDALCGFVSLDQGHVSLGDREITDASPTERARLGLGRSFQDARLFPSLTVFETLACAFERHMRAEDPVSTMLWAPWVRRGERRVARRVEEIIDLMGLGAFRDKFISELSTGSRRVVDLACVIAHEPTVLLLDEPSSGMAQKETEAMGPLLRRVKEATGCTMLLVEHDMPLVTTVSDELIAMETGRVIVRGNPKKVTNDRRVIEAYLGTDDQVVARSGAVRAGSRRRRKTSQNSDRSRAKARAKSARTSAKRSGPSGRSAAKRRAK